MAKKNEIETTPTQDFLRERPDMMVSYHWRASTQVWAVVISRYKVEGCPDGMKGTCMEVVATSESTLLKSALWHAVEAAKKK